MIALFARLGAAAPARRNRLGATVLATTVIPALAIGLAGCSGETDQLAVITNAPSAPVDQATATPAATGFPGQPSPTATLEPGVPPQPPPSSQCPESGVNVVLWAPDAALGLRVYALRGFNCSGRTITLRGYPSIRLLDGSGERLDVAVVKGVISSGVGNPKPATVTLRPGQSATTVLSWRNTTEIGSDPITSAYLRVVPGKDRAAQVIALSADLGTTAKIAVTAWARSKDSG